MIWHRYVIETLLPFSTLMKLGKHRWYRRMFGGHWEMRSYVGRRYPGGPIGRQEIWVHTGECGKDKYPGLTIDQCEDWPTGAATR